MWKQIKDSEYFFSYEHANNYEIYVTDYIGIWTLLFSEKAFINQLKSSNKGLQYKNVDDYIQKGKYLLSNTDQLKKTIIRKSEDAQSLFMSLKISSAPNSRFLFGFECDLIKGSEELYFKKITQPLLKTVFELRSSQAELMHNLTRKDVEINEYKTQCDERNIILRESRKTVPFNKEEYVKKIKHYDDYFGATDVPPSLLEKSVATGQNNMVQESTTVPITKEEPKEEPKDIKQEPVSVKVEQFTPMFEEPSQPVVIPTVSCKQEVIKREQESSQARNNNDRRKRLKKLNL